MVTGRTVEGQQPVNDLRCLSPFWEVQARPENRSGVNFFSFCKLVKTDCSREF